MTHNRTIAIIIAMILCVLVLIMTAGCTDKDRATFASFGEPHTIQLYSGGKVVATFESTGKVECSEGGICSFMDATTKKLVRTSGDVVIFVK